MLHETLTLFQDEMFLCVNVKTYLEITSKYGFMLFQDKIYSFYVAAFSVSE